MDLKSIMFKAPSRLLQ